MARELRFMTKAVPEGTRQESSYMPEYGWLLDAKRCIECRACESACKQWNEVPTGINVRWRVVRIQESGKFPNVKMQALSSACNHCENPYCAKVCPTKSISRRADGVVLIDPRTCIGCGQCAKFCPYGAPQLNTVTRKMEKCTFCVDRQEEGLEPACATLCPTGALKFGKWEDLQRVGADRTDGFANPAQTRPRIRFVTAGFGRG